MLIVSDALVVCESDSLKGLVKFALGRYWGVVVRGASDFDQASAALVERAPQVAIIDVELPNAADVAHLVAPGTRIVAINVASSAPSWADAATPVPFQPPKLHEALERALA
jgi:DNA-binding NtrC family response regulator